MLIMSLLLSLALLLIANVVARKSGRIGVPSLICGLGAFLGVPCLMLPALMLTGVLMALCGIFCRIVGRGPPLFLKWSVVSIVASHLLIGIVSWRAVQERRVLREQFPTESLAQRLSYETPRLSSRAPVRPEKDGTAASKALSALEDRIEDSSFPRTYSLRWLHQESVADFINSPGFGISRGVRPRKEYIELPEIEPIMLPQAAEEPPISAADDPATPGPITSLSDTIAILPAEEALHEMHQSSVIDFVNAEGFGFIKDREHVTGFQAHHFHAVPHLKSPVQTERWRIQSLELVSLLKHEEPVAYLSKHLPRMDELQDAPTRPLSSFEKQALAELQKGQDLRTEATTNRIHMLGSIRAIHQCLACHRVERGDLLGAFSYTLLREPPDRNRDGGSRTWEGRAPAGEAPWRGTALPQPCPGDIRLEKRNVLNVPSFFPPQIPPLPRCVELSSRPIMDHFAVFQGLADDPGCGRYQSHTSAAPGLRV